MEVSHRVRQPPSALSFYDFSVRRRGQRLQLCSVLLDSDAERSEHSDPHALRHAPQRPGCPVHHHPYLPQVHVIDCVVIVHVIDCVVFVCVIVCVFVSSVGLKGREDFKIEGSLPKRINSEDSLWTLGTWCCCLGMSVHLYVCVSVSLSLQRMAGFCASLC